jgi:hypothetical protein
VGRELRLLVGFVVHGGSSMVVEEEEQLGPSLTAFIGFKMDLK